jgi:hypothetical protein
MNGTFAYTASGLPDIAESFHQRARKLFAAANSAETNRNAIAFRAQAQAWDDAAEILENTTIIEQESAEC